MVLLDLFKESCRMYTEKIAVYHKDRELSFADLSHQVKSIAANLSKYGIQNDDCVGLYLDPSLELVLGVWGSLMAGACYLPLSPEYPIDRIKYMVKDSRTKYIVTTTQLKSDLANCINNEVIVLTIEDLCNNISCANDSMAQIKCSEKNVAYIIYTSGSTGNPKGVMIEHKAIVNQMKWLKKEFSLDQSHRILQKTPISFDAAQWEILLLCCGCSVVIGEKGIYKNPDKIMEYIQRHQITLLQCVPTLLQALVEADEFTHCDSLKIIFSGGEALRKKLAVTCLNKMPNCSLVNLYGPTECTINSSFFVVNKNNLASFNDVVPIGKPVDGLDYVILNDDQTVCAVNDPGELCVRGLGLARGYLHKPELTAQRFIQLSEEADAIGGRVYKTGDIAYADSAGVTHFLGRKDNQVKLRGYRIELDEISSRIARHRWVKHAATGLTHSNASNESSLISFIELDHQYAPLMDQGLDSAHHRSKKNKAQVTLQLANKGVRDDMLMKRNPVISLPRNIPTQQQIYQAFSRKTYRFFEGSEIHRQDILQLLTAKNIVTKPIKVSQLEYEVLAEIMRYFGQYKSQERLLPKYAYASPGALYPTQMYIEITGMDKINNGYYYYNPVNHELVLIRGVTSQCHGIKVHFIGKKSAIEPIYKNNIQEVLEMETGHMIGLFEKVLAWYGLTMQVAGFNPLVKTFLQVNPEDYYLGSFQFSSGSLPVMINPAKLYVQVNNKGVDDIEPGLYLFDDGRLCKISNCVIEKKSVIAINQSVYDRSALGISIVLNENEGWLNYIHLGRKLQQLQMNDDCFGFMSSGYSSKTGNDLATAVSIGQILNSPVVASYFCLGGRISSEQIYSQGMSEDVVHMDGPAELIKKDLQNFMPDYMLPRDVILVDKMPLSANGKIDIKSLIAAYSSSNDTGKVVLPATKTQIQLASIWKQVLKKETVSIQDSLFDLGANSLSVVVLANRINKKLKLNLPLQLLFKYQTIEQLAHYLDTHDDEAGSRMILLQDQGNTQPVYCWPGLGGCVMNLRAMSEQISPSQPFYGVQVKGINKSETIHANLEEMALADIEELKRIQPTGPYELWGYSFGARAAFETAYQLIKRGDLVSSLVMIAPGHPGITGLGITPCDQDVSFSNHFFLSVLVSVFIPQFTPRMLESCFHAVSDEDSFVEFIRPYVRSFSAELIQRITRIVCACYGFHYSPEALDKRFMNIPIICVRAKGDHASFVDQSRMVGTNQCIIIDSPYGHYDILGKQGAANLVNLVAKAKLMLKNQYLEVV